MSRLDTPESRSQGSDRMRVAVCTCIAMVLAHASHGAEAGRPHIDLAPYLPAWMNHQLLGVAIWQALAAFLFILAGLVAKVVAAHAFGRIVRERDDTTRAGFNQLIAAAAMKPLAWLLCIGGLAGAAAVLSLPTDPNVRGAVYGALWVLLVADFIWFLFRIVDVVVAYLGRLASKTESTLDDQLVPMLSKALKVTLLIVCFIWVLQLLGYSVSSLIAGLGIGGLAVALALQDTLGNFFGSVFVFLDKAFSPGDWVKIGEVEGIVEEIGFRSTRLRTWPESLVSIPNKTVASSVIDNWSKMPRRRVYQNVPVTYDATPVQMAKAVREIKTLIESDDDIDKGFYLIRFTDFTEAGLNIMLYYFTKSIGWDAHLAVRERVNLSIMRILEGLGLRLAVPARQVFVRTDEPPETPAGLPEGEDAADAPASARRSRRSKRSG